MRSFALFDVASDAAAASCDAPAETRAASAQRSGSAGGAETAVSPPAHDAWCAADFAWDPRELVRTALRANTTRPETRLTRTLAAQLAASAAPPAPRPRRKHVLTSATPRRPLCCEVAGCAQSLSGATHGKVSATLLVARA